LREQTQPYEETIDNNIRVDACKIKIKSNVSSKKGQTFSRRRWGWTFVV